MTKTPKELNELYAQYIELLEQTLQELQDRIRARMTQNETERKINKEGIEIRRDHAALIARQRDDAISKPHGEAAPDPNDLVPIKEEHLTGATEHSYKHKGNGFAPDWTFEIQSKVPIYKWKRNSTKSATWTNSECPVGSGTFTGRVITELRKDASASVELFTSKKYTQWDEKIKHLNAEIAKIEPKNVELERASQALSTEFEIQRKDLAILAKARRAKNSAARLPKKAKDHLEAENIAGIATHLELRTATYKRDFDIDVSDWNFLRWVMHQAFSNHCSACLAQEKNARRWREISDETRQYVKVLDEGIIKFDEVLEPLQKGTDSIIPNVSPTAKEASEDLKQLELVYEAGSDAMIDHLREGNEDDFDLFSDSNSVSPELEKQQEAAKRDLDQTMNEGEALALAQEDFLQERRPIGIVAALGYADSPVEAWYSSYKGYGGIVDGLL